MIFILKVGFVTRLYVFFKNYMGRCFVPDFSENKQLKQTQEVTVSFKVQTLFWSIMWGPCMFSSEMVLWRKNHTDLSGPIQSVQTTMHSTKKANCDLRPPLDKSYKWDLNVVSTFILAMLLVLNMFLHRNISVWSILFLQILKNIFARACSMQIACSVRWARVVCSM